MYDGGPGIIAWGIAWLLNCPPQKKRDLVIIAQLVIHAYGGVPYTIHIPVANLENSGFETDTGILRLLAAEVPEGLTTKNLRMLVRQR
jgi:hypothetical protein